MAAVPSNQQPTGYTLVKIRKNLHLLRAAEAVGSQSDLARKVGCNRALVNHMIIGRRGITAEMAVAIEQATDGAVSRADLRPDLFRGFCDAGCR